MLTHREKMRTPACRFLLLMVIVPIVGAGKPHRYALLLSLSFFTVNVRSTLLTLGCSDKSVSGVVTGGTAGNCIGSNGIFTLKLKKKRAERSCRPV